MKISRKGFLEIGGLSLLAVAGKTAIGALLGKGEGADAFEAGSGASHPLGHGGRFRQVP